MPVELTARKIGRDCENRTRDPLLPKQVLYQAELSPVLKASSTTNVSHN